MACVRAPYEKSGFVRSLTDNVARESSPYPQAKWYELDKFMRQFFWLLAIDEETEKLVNIGVRAFKNGAPPQGPPN